MIQQTARRLWGLVSLGVLGAGLAGACSAVDSNTFEETSAGSGASSGQAGTGTGGFDDVDAGQGGGAIQEDPTTCAEAEASASYVGCDFWPTVVDNIVRPLFDYAVVVANTGAADAVVTVMRQGATVATATVGPSALSTIYLPWVDELKSTAEGPFCSATSVKLATVRADGGAYHLTSTRPVTVYQFSAIEYAGSGGPAGKDWSHCLDGCFGIGCFSYTNDASLLLPSTAMTGTYRVAGPPAWPDETFTYPPYFAVTGTKDGTSVSVKLGSLSGIVGGGGVATTPAGGTATFTLNAGDVVEVIGEATATADLSGSLVQASAPVQVIAGIACSQSPDGVAACDHMEESVFPAETLGKHYFVTVPTSPLGTAVGHVVRLYGNVDGTALTYAGSNPGGPSVIGAGQVVDLGVVTSDFEIQGDHELAVSSFQLGADQILPGVPIEQQKGDPSQSFMTSVEQYRTKYVFLAPTDYDVSYVDIVAPDGATVSLDGSPIAAGFSSLGSGFGIARVLLGAETGGAHVLTASAPVGIQVVGYGTYTSYQYPGGLNLGKIAPAPPK